MVRKGVVFLFYLAVLIAGAAGMAYCVADYQRAATSHQWQRVEGTIIGDGREGFTSIRDAHYRYVVNGALYTNKRTRFLVNNRVFRRDGARAFLTGDFVAVYVQPGHPNISVLIHGAPLPGFLMLLGACGLLVFIGAGGVWYSVLSRYVRRSTASGD